MIQNCAFFVCSRAVSCKLYSKECNGRGVLDCPALRGLPVDLKCTICAQATRSGKCAADKKYPEEISAPGWETLEVGKLPRNIGKMRLICRTMGASCSMKYFFINGIQAKVEDFGEAYDHGPSQDQDYSELEDECSCGGVCCYNMQFEAKPAREEILIKYGISEEEYRQVCEKLKDEYNFGACAMCN